MPTQIKITVRVAKLDNVLQSFDQIQVFRSVTGINGAYAEISGAGTRINMQQGVESYEYDDTNGDIIYYYKTRYYNSGTLNASNFSAPILGDEASTANIMTVSDLKDLYLFGVDLTNDAGQPFPDLLFEWGIRWAIAWVERKLDIRIRPTVFVDEKYDYYVNDYLAWTIINLRESPVISVEKVKVMWPAQQVVIDFPPDWIQLRQDAGQVNIVPSSGSLSQMLLTAGGSFLPLIASGRGFVPNMLSVDYTAGFPEGQVPMDLRDLIGKLASFGPLNIAGDLIAGAGIASKSISIDGLSQSVNTTSSATNAGYGSRLIQYSKEIKEVIPTLQRYYKRIDLAPLG